MEDKQKSLLDEAVKGTEFSRIDIVKIAYMDYLLAKRHTANIQKIFSQNLPKKIYTKRKSHKSMDFISKKTGVPRKSKYIQFFDRLMQSQQRVSYLFERFESLAKQLTPQEKDSILTGIPLPVNVMAKPAKGSILAEINSSREEKTNDKKEDK